MSLGPGVCVRVLEPPAGRAMAKFRGRVGVVEYEVAGGCGEWVVAVERLESEWATSHVVCQPENAFEFLALAPSALEVVDDGGAALRPSYRPGERYDKRRRVDRGLTARRKAKRVGVIVPFRDLHAEQHRAAHLAKFVPHMATFLGGCCEDYRVVVVEQSDDGRKFNRGQLLNVGYLLARAAGCDAFVFHDVDLLPSAELGAAYATVPRDDRPCHVARVWDRAGKG